ncbi:MAG: protein kinase, partial [Verrucomicrobiales bacterium]|nr:protein kinase [Verrucomicrobiales bacterium]
MIDPENYGFHDEESVGSGCCGEVVRATDPEGKTVALKQFNSMAIDRHFLETNYRRYARLSKHSGIVDIHGYQFKEHPYFIVMDWIEGKTLDEIGHLPEGEAWQRIYEIADALAHLHKHALVHTNLHPGNIFFTEDQQSIAKITDFGPGLAGKVHHIDLGETAYYAPPEQLENPENFDDKIAEQWDVYRFGVIAFWLINGTLPRGHGYIKARGEALEESGGRPVPVDYQAYAADVRENPEFHWNRKTSNRAFRLRREIVEKCLSICPNERPLDMRDVRTSFRALEQQFVLEDAENRVVRERKLQKMKLIVTRTVAACLAISLTAASYFLIRYLHRTISQDKEISKLEHVTSTQKADIEKRDRLLSEIEHDLK